MVFVNFSSEAAFAISSDTAPNGRYRVSKMRSKDGERDDTIRIEKLHSMPGSFNC